MLAQLFIKMLVQLFEKCWNIFLKKMLQHFVINNYEMGWLGNNKQQV
jgi:hypothetical protein